MAGMPTPTPDWLRHFVNDDPAARQGYLKGASIRQKASETLQGLKQRLSGQQPPPPSAPEPPRTKRKPVPAAPSISSTVYSVALEQQLALVRASTEPLIAGWFDQMYRNAMQVKPGTFTEPRDKLDVARTFAGQVAKTTPFYWTGAIADVVLAASRVIPDYTFTAESFPVADGFVWLEHPVELLVDDDAIVRDKRGRIVRARGPIKLTAWHWNVSAPTERSRREKLNLGDISLWGYTAVPQRAEGFPTVDASIHLGWTLNEQAEGRGRTRGSTAEFQAFLKFVAASLSFLEQDLVVAPRGEAHRSARRRLEKQAPQQEPFIKVVELRRRHYVERGDDSGEIGEGPDWKNRWIVSGHWRKQYYPSTEAHKPLYIAPYVKGPEDRPLKAPKSKLFVVKR